MLKTLITLLSLLSCALPAAATPTSHDSKLLQGVWVPVAGKSELAGAAFAPTTLATMKLTLKGEQFEFVEGPTHDVGRFTVNADQKPKQMDIIGVKGPNAGRTIPAIYRLEGDRLTICYGLDGHRPKAFASPKKSMILLAVFARKSSGGKVK